jgi:arginyl-tRNA synthetase
MTSSFPTFRSPVARLDAVFRRAIVAALGPDFADADPQVKPSQSASFGDFQVNGAMSIAKRAGLKPREVAVKIVDHASGDLASMAEPLEVAGPGFINIRLKPTAIASMLDEMSRADLGVERDVDARPIVVDMCSVNVAKQMHVGHLRSTIIGDAFARLAERRGRRVIRQNHLGDWGLQIGMVLHQLRASKADLDALDIARLEAAYRDAQLACKVDERGLEAARRLHAGPHRMIELAEQNAGAEALLADVKRTLVRLQAGEPELVRDWTKLIRVTMRAVYDVIDLLGVSLDESSERGESFYRDQLSAVVEQYVEAGVAREDEGAIVVPFADRERPLLIRKSDGGFLYATTDLAAIRYRVHELHAGRIIYVVDARQRDHFKDVFDAARLMRWTASDDGREVELVHVGFGSVLGTDGRPLKTRSGENVSLKSLLLEAIDRGTAEVRRRAEDADAPTHGVPDEELRRIGRAVGIGAVKYADLSNDLLNDYVFNFDRMIAFEGNTGPYIQYAHARISSIFAKAEIPEGSLAHVPFTIAATEERTLALLLLRQGQVVRDAEQSLQPHRLCTHLYEVANAFSAFYQACPVLRASPEERSARLRLCSITKRVIADGLQLMGIETPSRM